MNNIFIELDTYKEPYIKELTSDKIINLTGQTGSGKSTYASTHFNNDSYLIVDTDDILNEKRFNKATGINKEIGEHLRKKYEVLPNLENDFDLIYKEILENCSNIDKTIVIDCAQFHQIKDINILKGKIIILRTDINTCYERTITRWINNNSNYAEEDLEKFKAKKKGVFEWYKYTNKFLEEIDKI